MLFGSLGVYTNFSVTVNLFHIFLATYKEIRGGSTLLYSTVSVYRCKLELL